MTTVEIERLTTILQRSEVELTGSRSTRDDIVIEKASDKLDEVQLKGERELAIRVLDRNSAKLRQVRFALAKVAEGTYGICLHCEEDISPKRMAALPWATSCIKCQEKIDRREIEVDDTPELLAYAS